MPHISIPCDDRTKAWIEREARRLNVSQAEVIRLLLNIARKKQIILRPASGFPVVEEAPQIPA